MIYAFEKILSKSDVYISNLSNGVLEKLGPYGYTPEQVLKRHPHIVATIMTDMEGKAQMLTNRVTKDLDFGHVVH